MNTILPARLNADWEPRAIWTNGPSVPLAFIHLFIVFSLCTVGFMPGTWDPLRQLVWDGDRELFHSVNGDKVLGQPRQIDLG